MYYPAGEITSSFRRLHLLFTAARILEVEFELVRKYFIGRSFKGNQDALVAGEHQLILVGLEEADQRHGQRAIDGGIQCKLYLLKRARFKIIEVRCQISLCQKCSPSFIVIVYAAWQFEFYCRSKVAFD